MTDRLPDVPADTCLSCGLRGRPMLEQRCDLCSAAYGLSLPPEPIQTILPRVLADLREPYRDAS